MTLSDKIQLGFGERGIEVTLVDVGDIQKALKKLKEEMTFVTEYVRLDELIFEIFGEKLV